MQTHQVVLRRGADVVGPDGPIGTMSHVVVDESTREVSELVVLRSDGSEWVVPVTAVADTTEQDIRLTSSWSDLRSTAYDYAPDEFESISHSELASRGEAGTLELREEELRVRKHRHAVGAVELRKEVVAERQVLDIPLWREELVLEREPIDPPEPTETPIADHVAVRVVLREEVAVVDKQPVVNETVRAGRRTVSDTQHIDTTIHKEIADVRREGDIRVQQS